MSAVQWLGLELFFGRVRVGSIARSDKHRDRPWVALCALPGARRCLGYWESEEIARAKVFKSASSRIRGMTGASISATHAAIHENRRLRIAARAMVRAGVWECESETGEPVDAETMLRDLARGVGLPPETGRGRNSGPTTQISEPLDVIEETHPTPPQPKGQKA